MASRRARSKRKQVGSSSTGGQAQEEGNISQSNLFLDIQASTKYEIIKNMAVLSCNFVKFNQFLQGDMHVEQIFRELRWKDYVEINEPVYYEVVHQFYANLKPRGNKCKTMVLVYYEVVHQFYANLKPRGNKCKTIVDPFL
ncbi:hypothetical protein SLEP1_g38337 [Rubroshorea leprosula]|nr:hypothetical protein SLEP1_g38337 [Rubroshorea leprosula]